MMKLKLVTPEHHYSRTLMSMASQQDLNGARLADSTDHQDVPIAVFAINVLR